MNINNKQKLHVVLYEPEIAGNVGTIMRTCYALNAKLHLIQPFGFFLDDRFLERASVHYINEINYNIYDDWNDFQIKNPDAKLWYTTSHTKNFYTNINFANNPHQDIFIVFGRESTGIPQNILKAYPERCLLIPMQPAVRSLNLANAVAIVMYEIARQINWFKKQQR